MTEGRPAQSTRYMPRTRPVVPPIHQSVTYFLDDESYKDVQAGGLDEIWYGRFRNPTVDVAAEEVARLEGAEAGFMTSSGMGAIATTLLTLLRAGDRVVAATQVYGDTRDLLVRDLPRGGSTSSRSTPSTSTPGARPSPAAPTRVLYVETLANPQLELADLPALAAIAHDAGALLVVDNTFATPYTVQPSGARCRRGRALGHEVPQRPLRRHRGVVVGGFDLVREVQRRVVTLGTCLDPHAAYLVWRGMQTFDLRLARSNATARRLAAALAEHADVVGVRHPSLPDYPRAEVADRVLRRDGDEPRTGAMVSFTVAGGDERALQVMRRLEVACEATSLGGVETLVSTPFNSSHFSLTAEERRSARIDDGMIRMSCGVEPTEALVADFTRALDAS